MEHEQITKRITRQSALIYLSISLSVGLLFLLAATFGGFPSVARIGGTIWITILSLIVTMPIVTSWVKRQ